MVEDPESTFLFATQGASVGIDPYQNNLAIGSHSLNPKVHHSPSCTSAAGFDGFCGDEVAFGDFTLQRDVTGRDNTAIGDHALANLVSGEGNTAVGSSAAANVRMTNGVDAFGVAACQDGRDFRGPVACIGQAALKSAQERSQYSVALGFQSGLNATTAEFSTLLGAAAGFSAASLSYSILLGEGACHNATSANNVICIGTLNGPVRAALSDRLWIGGNNDGMPILYGDLNNNALGLNTTRLAPGAALTVGGGSVALADKTTLGASTPGELEVSDAEGPHSGGHIVAGYVRTRPTSIAKLPTLDPAPTIGDRALVTDARGCTFGVIVIDGGAATCPVYYDGKAWVAG